ncbi:ABC transporter ATP-binding protein, partial [Anaerococcus obesiensis]
MVNKVIEVRSLVKKYKDFIAVDNLDLDLYEGEILGLLGPNGSGKSTTISCILSLLKNDGGSIKIFGEDMTPDSFNIKEKIGVVFQDVGVYDELSVYENIDYFCGLYIKDKNQRKIHVKNTIDLVGLGDFIKFKPKELSGGLLRRLNIACGI